MSHRIPMFMLPVASSPDALTNEWAENQIADAAVPGERTRLRESTSTNGWHVSLAHALARAYVIADLDFLAQPLSCVPADQALRIRDAVDLLLERLRGAELPKLQGVFGPELERLAHADRPAAIAAALPGHVIDDDAGDVSSFLTFLLSLRAAAEDASRAEALLVYHPQP